MAQSVPQARSYVQQLAIPDAPPALRGEKSAPLDLAFDSAKDQATVVGSDIVAFIKGITAEQRADLVNATMLAQLAAKKKVSDPQDLAGVLEWYSHYFDVLSNIGFVIQEKGFAEYEEKAETFEAHEAILDVAKVALAGAPGALAVVIKTLESLKKMSDDSPWITLFHRESRSAKTARFQVTLAETDETGGLLVRLMAFGVEAEATITQVLFFRFKKNHAKLRHHAGKVTINPTVLAGVRDEVAAKIAAHTKSFVAGLDI
jgi:hypothetical protein